MPGDYCHLTVGWRPMQPLERTRYDRMRGAPQPFGVATPSRPLKQQGRDIMSTEHASTGQVGAPHENCIFCRIANGEIPSHVVYEDDEVKAFLDIQPIRPGHVLIVPKAHHDYFDDLPPALASSIVH